MRRLALVALMAVSVGCDTGAGVVVPDVDLDAVLDSVITRDGQRGLRAFRHPASDALTDIPQDPKNQLTPEKVALGKLLFHESGLAADALHPSGVGTYSCATCHHADAGFQAGRRQAIGDGGSGWGTNGEARRAVYPSADVDAQPLRSPSILNLAYQDVMLWDGSLGALGQNTGTEGAWTAESENHLGYDGPETQAIAGLSNHRLTGVDLLATDPTYTALWASAFPGQDVSVERVGLAIAAYERTVFASQAPFQRWLAGDLTAMSDAEKRGAITFFGDVGCETCHTGPALSGPGFYALGMPDLVGPDVLAAESPTRGRGGFLGDASEDRKFKVPQLYNLVDSPFLGHGGNFTSVREVIEYYNEGVPAEPLPAGLVEPRFRPLELSAEAVADLTAFIELALRDPNLARYVPTSLPTGTCIPVNDPQARIDLGCN